MITLSVGYHYLESRRQEIFEEPELDGGLCLLPDGDHHDAQEALVEVSRGYAENVDCFF